MRGVDGALEGLDAVVIGLDQPQRGQLLAVRLDAPGQHLVVHQAGEGHNLAGVAGEGAGLEQWRNLQLGAGCGLVDEDGVGLDLVGVALRQVAVGAGVAPGVLEAVEQAVFTQPLDQVGEGYAELGGGGGSRQLPRGDAAGSGQQGDVVGGVGLFFEGHGASLGQRIGMASETRQSTCVNPPPLP